MYVNHRGTLSKFYNIILFMPYIFYLLIISLGKLYALMYIYVQWCQMHKAGPSVIVIAKRILVFHIPLNIHTIYRLYNCILKVVNKKKC